MNAVYPYILSKHDEIKWSLRSLDRHTDLEPVIIGEKPEWYTGRFIAFPRSQHKITNVYFKLRRACLDKSISETFLLMNDDIFLLKPLLKSHIVNGKIEDLWSEYDKKHPSSYYTQCLAQTVMLLGTAWNYETHTPMWMDKKGFMGIDADLFIDNPPLFRTMYGAQSGRKVHNLYIDGDVRPSEVKYYHNIDGQPFWAFIKGKPCFSTADRPYILNDLENLYPNKSKWEL